MNAYSTSAHSSSRTKTTSKKKHIDDAQPATVNEHLKLLREDRSIIDSEYTKVTADDLPEWFDEKLFKKGQEFQKNNALAFGTAHLTGLLAVFSVPGIANVLSFTKQSGTPCGAFKRYVGTVMLTRLLLMTDIFDANLRWFKGLNVIRMKHAMASKNHLKGGFHGIYQRDMVITQFGFAGFAFIRLESVGLAHCTHEDLEGLNHFWRVTGHLLGIPDRINICRKTVEETTELCRKVANEILVEYLENPVPEFHELAHNVMTGLWYGDVLINKDACLSLMYDYAGTKYPTPLSWSAYLNLKYRELLLHMCSLPYIGIVTRTFFNHYLSAFYAIVEYYPVIAWMKFGKENVQVPHY